ncbi:uncharacterized protein LOC107429770 isoform X8 [Ziziphus jujuba]|uniref:Uncharacterized protein LOC107429770 isoform X8 n=1 Tax=Ziziphus jujuba TaxID=326968 RepID=A0ABM4ACC5_ZIZJJ|nr:uncharacterized protein LOC107429770 isoform X8 [Ziziphus jujuba]
MKLQGQEEGHFIVFRLTSQLLTSLPTILAFSLCWCKECRNYTCSKHICGGIPSFEKSFMLEGIPVINLVGKLRELKKRLECLVGKGLQTYRNLRNLQLVLYSFAN